MRMSSFMRGIGAVGLSAILAVGALGVSAAKAVDFSGERITIIVPFNEGGGTDSYTRFMLPYFQKYLPGNPKIIVQNKPGAGDFGRQSVPAKSEGGWNMVVRPVYLHDFEFRLGRPSGEIQTGRVHSCHPVARGTFNNGNDLGTQNISDLKVDRKIKSFPKDKLVFGGKTPTSAGLSLRVGLNLLGIETKDVWGMKGNGPMALAFEQGEFTINFDNTLSYRTPQETACQGLRCRSTPTV